MRSLLRRSAPVLTAFFAAFLAGEVARGQEESITWKDRPLVISLTDDDFEDSRRLREFGRLLEKAEEEQVSAIIFDLDFDRPASDLDFHKALEKVSDLLVPTASYISSSAIGPGALLALGTDSIYMGPSAIVGSAGIAVIPGDSEEKEAQTDKQKQSLCS